MSSVLAAVTVADTVANLLEQALGAASKYAALQKTATSQGRELTLDDLKGLRADDGKVRADLEAAIAAHEAAEQPNG